MDTTNILNVDAPIAVSSVIHTATLPQTVRETDQRNQSDNAAVRLNLSPAAQNLLSSQGDISGNKPVPEIDRQEGRPSDDPDQKSRDDEEARKESKRKA